MAKVSDILKDFRKAAGSFSAAESPLAKITGTIDTGCYAINRIISGSIYEGIPEGRVIDIYGESQSGKSWLAANIIVNALMKNGYKQIFYFDSEGGALFDYIKAKGVDLNQIEHIPVHSSEDCKVKMVYLYDKLAEMAKAHYADPENNEMPRALCVLDSFGMLASDKDVADADKGKTTVDMGINTRVKNSMMMAVSMRVVESNCALVVINQIYRNPGQLFPSKIIEQPGGERLKFVSTVQLQMSKLLIKANDDDYTTGADSEDRPVGFFKGNRVRAFAAKNRVGIPYFEAEMFIDFIHGIAKYDGLIEAAESMGYIEKVRGGYLVPSYSDKRVSFKDLVSKDEIWDTFIKDFDEKSKKQLTYSNGITAAIDEIEASTEKKPKRGKQLIVE